VDVVSERIAARDPREEIKKAFVSQANRRLLSFVSIKLLLSSGLSSALIDCLRYVP
jgi:hypothetical protein